MAYRPIAVFRRAAHENAGTPNRERANPNLGDLTVGHQSWHVAFVYGRINYL